MAEGLSLKKNIAWNSAGSIVRLGCNYLITIAVVRLSHGFDAAGALSLAMSISNLVAPFADFRLRTVQVTDVRGEHSSGDGSADLRGEVCGQCTAGESCSASAPEGEVDQGDDGVEMRF